MDMDSLVDIITARVKERLSLEQLSFDKQSSETIKTNEERKKILILTQEHSTECHKFIDKNEESHCRLVDCALLNKYHTNIEQYDIVLLYQLDNEMLGRISSGIHNNIPYAKLAIEAILSGKKVYIPNEQIELYWYENTAPKAFYKMMYEKIILLRNSGVIFCSEKELEETLIHKSSFCEPLNNEKKKEEKKETIISMLKKVITERDMISAYEKGIKKIEVQKYTILSDLAKDYAHEKHIEIIRK